MVWMILYTLKCAADHGFDSWFRNADEFERLATAGLLSCPVCGSAQVSKALMAPAVTKRADAAPLSTPADEREAALARLRAEVEANSDYVGMSFATEARKMHAGEAPARAIHGEARPDEARALIDEGVPVMPLPFLPARKTN